MADNRNTLTDEILVLAETLGDIKARFERVESEFETQSKPLEAALAALSAAMTGIKTLQHHVLDNSLSALSLKVEEQRKAIDEQITVIVGELKGADAQNSEKIALQTAELKQQFSEISANVNQLALQFEGQLKRVELEAQDKLTKFAAVPGPQGPAGASINPRGNWIDGVTYNRLDVVSLLGTSYISAVENNTSKPARNGDKWTVLARAGTGGGGAGNFASLAGIAEVPQGGTGITQYAIGDILYANATGSLARLAAGVNGQFLKTTGAGGAPEWETPAGGGDVVGPASATDNALVRFDGTSGTAVQNSNATLTDAGALTLASNLTVSGTGLSSVAGSLNVTGSLLAHQTAALNLAYEGSSISQLVAYGADASTIGRARIVLRKAGTSTDAVTAADFTSTGTTLAGNLTVSGGTITSGSGTLTLNSSANTVVLQSAGTTALTLNSTQNATFAGTVKIANTAEIKGIYTTTTTFDFGTIANNDASSVCTLTMTGVSSSDSIIVTPTDGDNFPQFCTVSAVPSGNTVAVRLYNGSGSSRTVGSRTIRVTAIKF